MDQALQLDVVLENIIKHLAYKELKVVRLVNKYWNQIVSAELRKRSDLIALDHDLKTLKKVYNLELALKDKELTAKIPISAHVRRGSPKDWKVLKDVATHPSWRIRVTNLQLSDFWASDLNRLLPFLLSNMQNVTKLYLGAVNNCEKIGKSVIPDDIIISEVEECVKFPLTSVHVYWDGTVTSSEESLVLDPKFLRQSPALKEFTAEITCASHEVLGFFERLKQLDAASPSLPACDHVHLRLTLEEEENKDSLMDSLAHFINRTQPKSLDMSQTSNFDIVSFFRLLESSFHTLTMNVPSCGEEDAYYTVWLLKTLKKIKAFEDLQELQLKPDAWEVDSEPAELSHSVQHDLAKVTTLKIGFNPTSSLEIDKYKEFLVDAASQLHNVIKVEFYNLRFNNIACWGPPLDMVPIFDGLKEFPALKHLRFDVDDTFGDLMRKGQKIQEDGQKGVFEPLALLPKLQTFVLQASIDYKMSLDSALIAFFAGYEPHIPISLNLKSKSSGRVNVFYSKDRLKQILETAKPQFDIVGIDDW